VLLIGAPVLAQSKSYHGVELPVMLDININGQDDGAIVTPNESVSISFQASSTSSNDENLDWWILAGSEQFGWYWYEKGSKTFNTQKLSASQEHLFNAGNSVVLPDLKGLNADTYQVYFGADKTPNGRLDDDTLGYSQVQLQVVSEKNTQFSYQSDFSKSLDGWQGNFVDLPVDYDPEIYELIYEYAELPEEVNDAVKFAPMLQGHNRSDDLFMYMTRPLTGLKHQTKYRVSFDIVIASNVPTGLGGIGGAPAESVFFKAGVATQKPEPVISSDNYYRLNVSQGSQSNDGKDAIVLDHIGVDIMDIKYKLKTLNNQYKTFEFTTGDSDQVWILVGTDSGFEGLTRLYIPKVGVVIEEITSQ